MLKVFAIALALLLVLLLVALLANPPRHPVPATVGQDESLPAVRIDGVTFHAETRGEASNPTVIVVHGGPGGDYKNLLVLEALADDYHLVFYDQRGTGLSPRVPADQLDFDTSIEDLHRVVMHYGGGESVALIGHSWGGMMAAYYATRHPDMVARAVLAEPGVLTDEELQEFFALMQPKMNLRTLWYVGGAWFQSLRVRGPDAEAARDYFVSRLMEMPGEDNAMNRYWCDGEAPAAAHDMWRVGSLAMMSIQQAAMASGVARMPELDPGAYDGELLFVASRCNTLIGVERQEAHAQMFPNARVEIIEDAGHLMFTDQPEASLAVIRAYLAQWPGYG